MNPLVLFWLLAPAWAGPQKVQLEIPKLESSAQPVVGLKGLDVVATPNVGIQNLALPVSVVPQVTEVPGAAHVAVPVQAPEAQQSGAWIAAPQAVGPDVAAEQASVQYGAKFDGSVADAPELSLSVAPLAAGTVDQLVQTHSRRPLKGVFVQNEQEGSIIAKDPRDGSGSIFRWYKPVEARAELFAQVEGEMTWTEKAIYKTKRAFASRKDPYAAWNAFSDWSKVRYLGKLEQAVVAEKGEKAAWDGKVSLLLEKTKDAPDYLTQNPHMEAPPAPFKDHPGARFLQPELVTDKTKPAASVNEAIGRTSYIISQTGHAGTQYHVFMKLDPKTAARQLAVLQDALQLFNDALFARAARSSFENVAHGSLIPWHAGRSRRVAKLLAEAKAGAHTPAAEDPDSEKHAFVGFRYWGTENGKLVVSLELRGTSIPWKQRNRPAARDMGEVGGPPERDYAEATRFLTYVSLFAEKVVQGKAPRPGSRKVELQPAAIDAYLALRAKALGIPAGAYYGIEDFAKRVSGASRAPPGFLFPFAADAGSGRLEVFAAALLKHSARLKAMDDQDKNLFEDQKRTQQYLFWQEYGAWAASFQRERESELEALFRAVAAD